MKKTLLITGAVLSLIATLYFLFLLLLLVPYLNRAEAAPNLASIGSAILISTAIFSGCVIALVKGRRKTPS
jgi:uncharacterized membrane protein YbhN (UPF0104 family)